MMKRNGTGKFVIVVFMVLFSQAALALQPAFPGAEGAGAYAVGGRGGDVYYVTNLNDSGSGSLRNGIDSASGPRTIVFAVSGLIQLQSRLTVSDYITVAGQTAPGDGICVRDYTFRIDGDHVIVRYIRSRLGDESIQEADSMSITGGENIIMDHCSASWSVDETFSCSDGARNVTVQWCIISEALRDSIHSKGSHSYCALIRGHHGAEVSYHHNLFAHANSRMPRPGNYKSYSEDPIGFRFDFRNNVVYNFGGGSPGGNGETESITAHNFINNYYKAGPDSDSVANCVIFSLGGYGPSLTTAYFDGNILEGDTIRSQWDLVANEVSTQRLTSPLDIGFVTTELAEDAYRNVLWGAGASLSRDAVDVRVVSDVENGTGAIIDDEDEVGGWPAYNSTAAPTDSDQDGMADDWEISQGLNPSDPDDRNDDDDGDGYTNLEEYLHWLTITQIAYAEVTDDTSQEIGDDSATFTVKRMGGTSDYLPVYVTLGGDAVYQEDYTVSGTIYLYHGSSAFVNIPPGQSSASFSVHPINDFVFEGNESIVVTVEPDLSTNYALGDTTVVTGYIYDISGTDLTDFAVLSQFWQSSCGSDTQCQDVDFDGSGDIGIVDLQKFALRWLSEKGEVVLPPTPFDPILINFQSDDATVPDGYIKDYGQLYGDQGNGYTYGWDSDITDEGRDRNDTSDQRYDTLVHMKATWELEIPNGTYTVDLVMGDSDDGNQDMINDVYIEGVNLDDPDGMDIYDEYLDVIVTVTDGRLTVGEQPTGDNPKICFIEIR